MRTVNVAFIVAMFLTSETSNAQQPVSPVVSVNVSSPSASRVSRPCVLLRNQNVLFGAAKQRGEFVVVRKADGSELQVNRREVACWANSIRALYRYRVDHRRSQGIQAHLEDARWCIRYALFDLAAKELSAVYQIDPGNEVASRLAQQLRRAHEAQLAGPAQPKVESATIQLASHEQPLQEESCDAESLQRFARHIQPLLLNRCGNCHAHDSQRQWTLLLPAAGTRASARMTQANLAATMRYIDSENPSRSEIRSRAIDGHAGKSAASGARATSETDALDQWLRKLRPGNPPGHDQAQRNAADNNHTDLPGAITQAAHVDDPADVASNAPKGISRLPVVTNPFDPELFNRRFHRGKSANNDSVAESQ